MNNPFFPLFSYIWLVSASRSRPRQPVLLRWLLHGNHLHLHHLCERGQPNGGEVQYSVCFQSPITLTCLPPRWQITVHNAEGVANTRAQLYRFTCDVALRGFIADMRHGADHSASLATFIIQTQHFIMWTDVLKHNTINRKSLGKNENPSSFLKEFSALISRCWPLYVMFYLIIYHLVKITTASFTLTAFITAFPSGCRQFGFTLPWSFFVFALHIFF